MITIHHELQAVVIVEMFDLSDYSLVPWQYSEQRDAKTALFVLEGLPPDGAQIRVMVRKA